MRDHRRPGSNSGCSALAIHLELSSYALDHNELAILSKRGNIWKRHIVDLDPVGFLNGMRLNLMRAPDCRVDGFRDLRLGAQDCLEFSSELSDLRCELFNRHCRSLYQRRSQQQLLLVLFFGRPLLDQINVAMASSTDPLEVGVVGAGIAGLCAAIAVRRAGHRVTIYEKSTFKNEIGAAISITPNGNRILDRWGFDSKAAGETLKEQSRVVDLNTLELKQQVDLCHISSEYGHACNGYHRVDLHSALRRMAEQLGADVKLGMEATELNCEAGVLGFKSGGRVTKDLIIVADGLKVSIPCPLVLFLADD